MNTTETFRRATRRVVMVAVAAAAAILLPMPAGATAFYSGSASSTTEISVLPSGVTASGGVGYDVYVSTDGEASASGSSGGTVTAGGVTSGPLDPTTDPAPGSPDTSMPSAGDGVSASVSAAGDAGPSSGFAESDVISDSVFRFENTTAADEEVTLAITYGWSASVSVDDPLAEFAGFEVYLDAGIADLSDPDFIDIVDLLFFDEDAIFTEPGLPADSTSTSGLLTELVSFTVAAGSTVDFAIFTDVYGFAEAVPEPGTAALLLAGLLGLVARGRRRQT